MTHNAILKTLASVQITRISVASLVLMLLSTISFALPVTENEPSKIKTIMTESQKSEVGPLDEATLVKPEAFRKLSDEEKLKLFEAERQRWGDRHLGLSLSNRSGSFLTKDQFSSATGLALSFSQDQDYDLAHDYSFEILNSNILTLQMAQRNYFTDYERLYLPYWRVGAGTAYLASEGISTLFDLKKLNLFASAGLADLTNDNRKYFVDFGLGYSLIGFQIFINAGFNRNF